MKILYYNCPAGISGDMNLGAMVDLGVDPETLQSELNKLGLDGWEIMFSPDERQGITGIRCDVKFEEHHHHESHPESHPVHDHHHDHGHDHDHDHDHGHDHDHHHGHGHHHEHDHDHHHHDHDHDHHHGHGHHHHRTYRDIREIIERSRLGDGVKKDAIAVFKALAEAEGAVHGKPVDEVHFHEVGAIDSIVDIVGAAICWNLLEVDAIAGSTIELGGGTVKCAHGRMPVPAPATARLVASMPVSIGGTNKEATTPTGAALLAGKNCQFGEPVRGKVIATGIGIGQRQDPNLANVVYATLMESESRTNAVASEVVELVTNLDDMSPEHIAFLVEALLDAGALDVWQTPATFKKGRLGCVLSVLAEPGLREALTDVLLTHSSTLGIRWRKWDRSIVEREITEMDTSLGKVRKKSVLKGGKIVRSKYEYDDLREIAQNHGLPIAQVEKKISEQDV